MINQRTIKIRYFFILGYLIPLVLSVFSSVFFLQKIRTAQGVITEYVTSQDIERGFLGLHIDSETANRQVMEYLTTLEIRHLEDYTASEERANRTIQLLLEKILHHLEEHETLHRQEYLDLQREQLALLETIQNLLDKKQDLLQPLLQAQTEEEIETQRGALNLNSLIQTNDDLGGAFQALNLLQEKIVEENRLLERSIIDRLDLITVAFLVINVIVTVGVALTLTIYIVNRIRQQALQIASSSAQLSSTIEEQEKVTSNQATAVNEITTTIEELGVSSQQAAEQATRADESANQAYSLAVSNHQQQGTFQQESLLAKTQKTTLQVQQLGEKLDQVYRITSLVSDLASQTNMLALNAAVEAVRAGEAGKGFGVVAAEIRKLADQSRQSAESINRIIGDIQNAAKMTVTVAEEGNNAVGKIVEQLDSIVMSIKQISLNTRQQAAATEQVMEAMNSINAGAQQNASGIVQSREGVRMLNHIAQALKDLI